jgi:DNA-binding transcriptional ArsR family regulator
MITSVVNDLDATFAALAEPTRRRVIELLRERPRRASELAAAAGTSGPAMSRHLRVLRTSGLVRDGRVEHDARVHVYQLCPEPFDELGNWLEGVRAFWSAQLESYRAHVEETRGGRRS